MDEKDIYQDFNKKAKLPNLKKEESACNSHWDFPEFFLKNC